MANTALLVLKEAAELRREVSVRVHYEEGGFRYRNAPSAPALSRNITALADTLLVKGVDRPRPFQPRHRTVWESHMAVYREVLNEVVDHSHELAPYGTMVLRPDVYQRLPLLDDIYIHLVENILSQFPNLPEVNIPDPYLANILAEDEPQPQVVLQQQQPDGVPQEFQYYIFDDVPQVVIRHAGGRLTQEEVRRLCGFMEQAREMRKSAVMYSVASFCDMVEGGLTDFSIHNLHLPRDAGSLLNKKVFKVISAEEFQDDSTAEIDSILNLMKAGARYEVDHERAIKLEKTLCACIVQKKALDLDAQGYEERAAEYTIQVNNMSSLLHRLRVLHPYVGQTDFAKQVIRSNTDFGSSVLESYSRAMDEFAQNIFNLLGNVIAASN